MPWDYSYRGTPSDSDEEVLSAHEMARGRRRVAERHAEGGGGGGDEVVSNDVYTARNLPTESTSGTHPNSSQAQIEVELQLQLEQEAQDVHERLNAPSPDNTLILASQRQQRLSNLDPVSTALASIASQSWDLSSVPTPQAKTIIETQENAINTLVPRFGLVLDDLAKPPPSTAYQFLESEIGQKPDSIISSLFGRYPDLQERCVKEAVQLFYDYAQEMETITLQADSIGSFLNAHKTQTTTLLVRSKMEAVQGLLQEGGVEALRQGLTSGQLTSRGLLTLGNDTGSTSLFIADSSKSPQSGESQGNDSLSSRSLRRTQITSKQVAKQITNLILDIKDGSTDRHGKLVVPEGWAEEMLHKYQRLGPEWLDTRQESFSYDTPDDDDASRDMSETERRMFNGMDRATRDGKRSAHINNQYEAAAAGSRERDRKLASSLAFLKYGPPAKAKQWILAVDSIVNASRTFNEGNTSERAHLSEIASRLKNPVEVVSEENIQLREAGKRANEVAMRVLLGGMQGIIPVQNAIAADEREECV